MHAALFFRTRFVFFLPISFVKIFDSKAKIGMTSNLICWLLCIYLLPRVLDIIALEQKKNTIHKIGLFGHFGGVQGANQLCTSFCCIVIQTNRMGCMCFIHSVRIIVFFSSLSLSHIFLWHVNCSAIAYDIERRPAVVLRVIEHVFINSGNGNSNNIIVHSYKGRKRWSAHTQIGNRQHSTVASTICKSFVWRAEICTLHAPNRMRFECWFMCERILNGVGWIDWTHDSHNAFSSR